MFKRLLPAFFSIYLISSPLIAQVKDSLNHQPKDSTIGPPLDTLKDRGRLKLYAFIPATAAVAYGFAALNFNFLRKVDHNIWTSIQHDNRNFYTSADDYLRYVPVVAVYALGAAGIKGKNNFRDKTAIYLLSSAFTGITVNALKRNSNRMRPNRLNDYSFPSGHTATAFATAEFLRSEYGQVSVWYTVGGYSVATMTSVLRLYKSYHWFSDVVAGAGFGIISTKLAYLAYPTVQRLVFGRKKSSIVMMPAYQNGGLGLALSGKF
jgi:membrane-associated phospholipid phosphatase